MYILFYVLTSLKTEIEIIGRFLQLSLLMFLYPFLLPQFLTSVFLLSCLLTTFYRILTSAYLHPLTFLVTGFSDFQTFH